MVTAMIEATLKSLAEKRPVRIAEVLEGDGGQEPAIRGGKAMSVSTCSA